MTGKDAARGPSGLQRRELFRRTALGALAVGAPTALTGLAGCATSSGDSGSDGGGSEYEQAKTTTKNPLGVPKDAPLDVVIFKGGYSDEYAKYHEKMYQEKYGVKPKHLGTQEITGTQQQRFVNGNPPDVIDNSGAQEMDTFALIDKDQIHALGELLDAPSWDDPNTPVRDTLIENTLKPLTVDDKVYGINYTMNVSGIWYDQRLFEQHDWEPPKTWDQLMQLGQRIRKEQPDIAPWTYQGQYPGYMVTVFNAMVQKHGGTEVMRRIDNLEDGAWQQDAVRNTLDALYQLKARKLLMKGVAGLTHTQAQNRWARGQAAFIPCGSWLKSEIGSQLPKTFEMALQPTPSVDKNDALPYESCYFYPDETFLVPSQATNPWGGMEYLRIMLSKEGAGKFAELTASVPGVRGATDGVQKTPALESLAAGLDAAGDDVFSWQFRTWYATYSQLLKTEMGNLLAGRTDAAGFLAAMQAETDRIAGDKSIAKYSR